MKLFEVFAKKTYRDRAPKNYYVTFNMHIRTQSGGDFEVGDTKMNTVDFIGQDIDELARQVVDDDDDFPLRFERLDNPPVVGVFHSVEDEWEVAYMMVRD